MRSSRWIFKKFWINFEKYGKVVKVRLRPKLTQILIKLLPGFSPEFCYITPPDSNFLLIAFPCTQLSAAYQRLNPKKPNRFLITSLSTHNQQLPRRRKPAEPSEEPLNWRTPRKRDWSSSTRRSACLFLRREIQRRATGAAAGRLLLGARRSFCSRRAAFDSGIRLFDLRSRKERLRGREDRLDS